MSGTRERLSVCKNYKKDVEKNWNKIANQWSEQVGAGLDWYREYFNKPEMLKFVGNLKGKKVLDAGCGDGYWSRIFAKQGAKVIGVDLSSMMLEKARQEEEKEELSITYKKCSFTDLSCFENESFDVIFSFMALMDGPDCDKATKAFFRILRPEGDLFFNITHPCFVTENHRWFNDDDEKRKLAVRGYFSDEPYIVRWKFSALRDRNDIKNFESLYFPRTVSTYVNELIDAGFMIKRFVEPRPSEQLCVKLSNMQGWRDDAAVFLYVHAQKLPLI
jgi:ubiquinone/menaquinone biosynthesis C-methylase UbiE